MDTEVKQKKCGCGRSETGFCTGLHKLSKEEWETKQKLEPIGELKMPEPKRFEQCEWCYQFDGDEPQIFAWTDETSETDELPEVKFTLSNVDGAYIQFTDKITGKKFKLFARELSDAGIKMRNYQTQAFNEMINSKKSEENASENKETEA